MIAFPSVIVSGSCKSEGRTLVTDFVAFLALKARAPFSAFSADDPEVKEQWVPSRLSRLLGEEVVDLADAWGTAPAKASYFKAVGPSALDRPFLMDLSPGCNQAFLNAIEAGYFDGLPGDIFVIHVMNGRPDSVEGAREVLLDPVRIKQLERIRAREILVFNEAMGPLALGKTRMPVITLQELEFGCFSELRRRDVSIADLMMMEPRHYVNFLLDWPRALTLEDAVEASALVRAWVGRTWLAFEAAGFGSPLATAEAAA